MSASCTERAAARDTGCLVWSSKKIVQKRVVPGMTSSTTHTERRERSHIIEPTKSVQYVSQTGERRNESEHSSCRIQREILAALRCTQLDVIELKCKLVRNSTSPTIDERIIQLTHLTIHSKRCVNEQK